jgi:hypothetical protein
MQRADHQAAADDAVSQAPGAVRAARLHAEHTAVARAEDGYYFSPHLKFAALANRDAIRRAKIDHLLWREYFTQFRDSCVHKLSPNQRGGR